MNKASSILLSYFRFLDGLSATRICVTGLLCTALLFLLDLYSPKAYVFTFIYLLPLAFVTWFAGKKRGMGFALLLTALMTHHYYDFTVLAAAFDGLSTLGMFLVVVVMLSSIRQLLETEAAFSRTDHLTGVMNRRAFNELVHYENLKLRRGCCSFSLAYLDIDNFKGVNDTMGHMKGDELLKEMVGCISSNLRSTDVLARMGGDEFCIYLPKSTQDDARVVIQRIKDNLDRLLTTNDWPVSMSIGVITCMESLKDFDTIVHLADSLMYKVKNEGKDNVYYAVHPETGI